MADWSVTYRATTSPDTSRRRSPDLWGDCPWEDIVRGERNGIAFFDDFNNLPLAPTLTTQIAYGQYKGYATSGETLAGTPSVNSVETPGGILQGTEGTGLTHAFSLAQAYASYLLSGTAGTTGKLWFECRIAVSSVLVNHCNFFVGLGEVDQLTLSATVPFNDSVTTTSNAGALIGFNLASSAAPRFCYADRATSLTNVLTGITVGGSYLDGVTVAQAVPAAYTFFKLGFKYDPYSTSPGTINTGTSGSSCISIWADNVLQNTYMSLTTLAGTTYLGANPLGLILAGISGSSASGDAVFLDWWRVAQLGLE